MRYPVLTVRNPWAWAIAYGGKTVENRGWTTSYTGPLWIHAAVRARWDTAGAASPLVREAWRHAGHVAAHLDRATPWMPFGSVIALADVTGCHHARECQHPEPAPPGAVSMPVPRLCSLWAAPGQWHITLANVRPLAQPVAARGWLGLWWLTSALDAECRAQLREAPR